MSIRFKYAQVVLESLIPLFGFFLWDWGLYFILLFYYIDLLADHVITHVKSKRILTAQKEEKQDWLKQGAMGLLLLILGIVVTHFAIRALSPRIDFIQEIKAFWTYEEMGLQQGYVLVPLVFLMAYQQYKMDFLRLQKFNRLSIINLWKSKNQAKLLIIAFASLVLAIAQFFILPEWTYVIGIVVVSSAYSLFIKD